MSFFSDGNDDDDELFDQFQTDCICTLFPHGSMQSQPFKPIEYVVLIGFCKNLV